MNHPLTGSIERACGVRTNGVGRVTTEHLNLTRSLSDVWAREAIKEAPKPDPVPEPAEKPKRTYERAPRIPFAGKDHPGPLRLVDSSGAMFLHMSGSGMTRDKQFAWCGTRQQLEALRAKVQAANTLHEVPA